MDIKRWIFLLVLGCVISLPVSVSAQPKVRQLKINEGYQTHFYLFTYDSEGKVIYERKQLQSNGQLTNVEQTEWLNLGDSVSLQRKWNWVNGSWVAVHLIKSRLKDLQKVSEEYINLQDGKETVYKRLLISTTGAVSEHQFYELENNTLRLTQKILNTPLTPSRKRVIHTYYSGHAPSALLTTTYVVDQLGRTDSILAEFSAHGYPDERYLSRFFYNGNDTLPISKQVRKWNNWTYMWENESRTSYTYRPDRKLNDEVYEYFKEMRWIATHRYAYEYYPEGVLKEKVIYGSLYRQWRRLSTIVYNDLSEGYPRTVSSTYNFWGGQSGSDAITDIPFYLNGMSVIRKGSSIEIEYLFPNSVDNPSRPEALKPVVYPNPSDGLLFLAESHLLVQSWDVYDMQGRRLMAEQPLYPVNRIDISFLPAGMYLVRIVDSENKTRMQKVTKY